MAMSLTFLVMILISVTLSAFAQITLKVGMSSPAIAASLAQSDHAASVLAVATNAHVVFGLATYAAGAALWLIVLSRVDVTVAYPFVGLSFPLTAALGAVWLGESVGALRILGTLMITLGVVLVARS